MGRKRTFGKSMGGVEKSAGRKKREAKRRKREEARWAARSGPVVFKRIGGEESEPGTTDDRNETPG